MTLDNALEYVGKRVEIPTHYDLWIRGARFGTVCGARYNAEGRYLLIRIDHYAVKTLLKVPAKDWSLLKVLS